MVNKIPNELAKLNAKLSLCDSMAHSKAEQKIVAQLTLKGIAKMNQIERKDIIDWLKQQIINIREEGDNYANNFKARYYSPQSMGVLRKLIGRARCLLFGSHVVVRIPITDLFGKPKRIVLFCTRCRKCV